MPMDLNQLIKSSQVLTDDHIRLLVYQILRGLKVGTTKSVCHTIVDFWSQ